jgi:hypothetical protein
MERMKIKSSQPNIDCPRRNPTTVLLLSKKSSFMSTCFISLSRFGQRRATKIVLGLSVENEGVLVLQS